MLADKKPEPPPPACPNRTPIYDIPFSLDLSVGGANTPDIDGYVAQTGDGLGDSYTLWIGGEYSSFADIPMYNGGKNNDTTSPPTPVIGKAWIGYDCTQNILCVAAYLNDESYFAGPSNCAVVESDDESWVRFTDDNGYPKLKRLDATSFSYIKYPGVLLGGDRTIGE